VIVQVVGQGLTGRDDPAGHRARLVRGRRAEHDVLRPQRPVGAEQGAETAGALELDHEHPPPEAGCGDGHRSRYRGLPDASFAGHDDEPGGGEELQRIHSSLSEAQTCAD
jgi:hypothetical protein